MGANEQHQQVKRKPNIVPEGPVRKAKAVFVCRGCGGIVINYESEEEPKDCRRGDKCPWEVRRKHLDDPDRRWKRSGSNPAVAPAPSPVEERAEDTDVDSSVLGQEPVEIGADPGSVGLPTVTPEEYRAEWVSERVAAVFEAGMFSGTMDALWASAEALYDAGRARKLLP